MFGQSLQSERCDWSSRRLFPGWTHRHVGAQRFGSGSFTKAEVGVRCSQWERSPFILNTRSALQHQIMNVITFKQLAVRDLGGLWNSVKGGGTRLRFLCGPNPYLFITAAASERSSRGSSADLVLLTSLSLRFTPTGCTLHDLHAQEVVVATGKWGWDSASQTGNRAESLGCFPQSSQQQETTWSTPGGGAGDATSHGEQSEDQCVWPPGGWRTFLSETWLKLTSEAERQRRGGLYNGATENI